MGIGTAYQAQVPKTARKGRGHSTKHSLCMYNTWSFQLAFLRNLLQMRSEEQAGWKELVRDLCVSFKTKKIHVHCTSSCVNKHMPKRFTNSAALNFFLVCCVLSAVCHLYPYLNSKISFIDNKLREKSLLNLYIKPNGLCQKLTLNNYILAQIIIIKCECCLGKNYCRASR